MPDVSLSDIVERALRRVARSTAPQRRELVKKGARFGTNLSGWPKVPYDIEFSVWDEFGEVLEQRRENPISALVGAVMKELDMP